MKKGYLKVAAALLSTSVLFACSNHSDTAADNGGSKEVVDKIASGVTYKKEDDYTDWKNENPTYIELNGTEAEFDQSAAVLLEGKTLTIKTGGVYVLSGKWDNGQIAIDSEDKNSVRLVLNGVEINNTENAAINIINAEKTIISLQENTVNRISDGKEYLLSDPTSDEPNAAIFSKDDLTINGSGKLIVQANYNNGIASKDDLKITGGIIQIHSVDDGLMGRDLVAIKDGELTIEAGGDGIKSTNDKDSSNGNIALEGGTYDIKAGSDGVHAVSSLWIADGSYTITAGGGSPEAIDNRENAPEPWGNPVNPETDPNLNSNGKTNQENTEDTETISAKGLKATAELAVGGGTFNIDSSDDAVHSNKTVMIAGGELTIATGDDGVHADTSLHIKGGKTNVAKSYEGLESEEITISEGEIHVVSSDDGINVGGGNDGSGFRMPFSPENNGQASTEAKEVQPSNEKKTDAEASDTQSSTEENMLHINGGYMTVDADGDGLDSNGSIEMTDGTVIVNGPTSDGNGPLDYDGSFDMSGGFLIAAGSSGMVQATSEQSAQNSFLMTYPETQKAGTIVHLEDSEGNTITTFAPKKDYQSVFISSPELSKNASYVLYAGGSSSGSESDGLYKTGNYQGGAEVVEFTISESVTWLNESGITTGRSAGPGGQGGPGGAPGGQNRPEIGDPSGMFGDLDEETREKVQVIMEQERAGTITREEVQKQLKELGVEFPGPGERQ
ncbi:carbohydrate-binding domain-containing protein [Cytobacillus massiliigabonensis]|uniref:carbohydrate-binding domain-containing protein n=1 Tax=Cytobacillus massiliigabonensis TaxID=1871011 RepID=UPI000C85544F|nr:carbohydrate-binding domain-containing protein [Cytobacillus massiliigabonensis]